MKNQIRLEEEEGENPLLKNQYREDEKKVVRYFYIDEQDRQKKLKEENEKN